MKSGLIRRLRKFLAGSNADERCLPPKQSDTDPQQSWGFPRTQAPDLSASGKRPSHRTPGGRKG